MFSSKLFGTLIFIFVILFVASGIEDILFDNNDKTNQRIKLTMKISLYGGLLSIGLLLASSFLWNS